MVTLELFNHYPAPIGFEQNTLLPFLKKACKELKYGGLIKDKSPLKSLETVEINLIDDATIADLHDDYMNDPTTTDVITFHHGEVFVSYDTAVKEATERGIQLSEELFRYHLHGLLHLAGYDDLTESDYQEMHTLQEDLIKRLYA